MEMEISFSGPVKSACSVGLVCCAWVTLLHCRASEPVKVIELWPNGAPGEKGLLGGHLRFDGGVDAVANVFDAHEHVQFEVQAPFLLVAGPGVKAVAQIIVILVAELLQGVGADMVVGNDEAVFGNERAGAAAVEAHGRFLDVLEPRVGRVEAVLFLEQFARRMIEQPHAFVRVE